MDKVYCANPLAQFRSHREEILEAIHHVLDAGPYVLGPEVEAFESEFGEYHGVAHCVGVGSGTDALVLSLRALDIGPGDEVITVSHTALATGAAILAAGATPVLVDIEEDFYTMDPSKIEEAITPRTKAIIPVHLYGQPCDMDPILEIAKKYNLKVVEDCAQAHGATYKGQKVGTMGDAGCFSFYPTKNLGAIGDGGGIITSNPAVSGRLRQLRQYGWDAKRVGQEVSTVSRLDELQAAILRVKLKNLDTDTQKRQKIAEQYEEMLRGSVGLPKVRSGSSHVYHLYVVRSDDRNGLIEKLKQHNIIAGIHYPFAIHQNAGYAEKVRVMKDLRVTGQTLKKIVTLPMYPELDVEKIFKDMRFF